MKLVNTEVGIEIDLEENRIYELIIEHSRSFSQIVGSLVKQVAGEDGGFIISENNKELKIDKNAEILVDYYSISPNNRRILGKLYSKMEILTEDYVVEKASINSQLVSLIDKITVSLAYGEIEYDLDFKWADMFKLYNVGFLETYESLLEKLVAYIKILTDLAETKIVFLVNIKSYLSDDELEKLYQMIRYYKVYLILLEPVERSWINQEKRYIIDRDICFIDVN